MTARYKNEQGLLWHHLHKNDIQTLHWFVSPFFIFYYYIIFYFIFFYAMVFVCTFQIIWELIIESSSIPTLQFFMHLVRFSSCSPSLFFFVTQWILLLPSHLLPPLQTREAIEKARQAAWAAFREYWRRCDTAPVCVRTAEGLVWVSPYEAAIIAEEQKVSLA